MLGNRSAGNPGFHPNKSMKISSTISLAILGLIAFAGIPNNALAQQNKGGVKEATERQEAKADKVEKIQESKTGQAKDAKKKKPQSKAGKVTANNSQVVKAVAQEMNRYTNQQARLKKGRAVAEEKNDAAMKKKVNDLQPKVEEKHASEMAKLHKRFGEAEVNKALEVVENERKRGKDGKVNRAGVDKKKKQNQRRKEKNQGSDGDDDSKEESGE